MGFCLAEFALLDCTMGLVPSPLMVLPMSMVMADGLLLADIMCNIPFLNIIPFGFCISPENPMVIAAIIASLGSVTEAPCTPMTFDPWITTAPTVLIGGLPVIDDLSILSCLWGGEIIAIEPGEFCTIVP